MQVLLLGAGTVTSRLNMVLAEQGHSVVAQIAAFTPQHIDLFDFRAMVVISPEFRSLLRVWCRPPNEAS